jgi:hypothetical protein
MRPTDGLMRQGSSPAWRALQQFSEVVDDRMA